MEQEENISFESSGLFFNPHMRVSRSISSLIVGSIKNELSVIDGFSSTGIRGIRYKKENKNVKSLLFVDWSSNAIKTAMKNAKHAGLKDSEVNGINSDFNKFMINEYKEKYSNTNFIEIDPFGSPHEYIPIIMYTLRKQKEIYLSATATDVRVLCGPEGKAAQRHYLARTMNNMFTHETGTRILLGYIFRMGLQYNFNIEPIMSLSFRHHIKIIVKLKRDVKNAMESADKNIGYISYCSLCKWTTYSKFPKTCETAMSHKQKTDYAGPLWTGKLHNMGILKKALELNEKRKYTDKKTIDRLITNMLEENDMPPYFLEPSKVVKGEVKKISEIIECLKQKGFRASRTHFSISGFKTDANIETVKECIKK